MAFVVSCGSPEGNQRETATNNESAQGDTEGTAEAVTSSEENLQEDADYLVSAHINSQLQVALGKVANQKSQSQQLKEFGRQLTEENRQIQQNINTLATGAGIEIQPALTPEYSGVVDSIKSLSDKDFDKAFLDLVLEEHNEDIERFTSLSNKTTNPIVRDMLTDNLDILRRRQTKAQELRDKLN